MEIWSNFSIFRNEILDELILTLEKMTPTSRQIPKMVMTIPLKGFLHGYFKVLNYKGSFEKIIAKNSN